MITILIKLALFAMKIAIKIASMFVVIAIDRMMDAQTTTRGL